MNTNRTLNDYTKGFIITDKTRIEGGYVNNPDDRGGKTNHGITESLARRYEDKLVSIFNWNGKMRDLTKQMAYWIYKTHFWDFMKLDTVHHFHPLLADKMFDFGINAGRRTSVKVLQRYLTLNNNKGNLYPDLVIDGYVGAKTFHALERYLTVRQGVRGIWNLLHGFIAMQSAHYFDISESRERNETFTYGWVTRAADDAVEYVHVLGL